MPSTTSSCTGEPTYLTRSRLTAHTLPLLSSYVGMISMAAAVNSAPACLTALSDTFTLPESKMGLISAVTFVGIVLGICLSGYLSDRFSMKPFLLLGAGCQGVGMVGAAMAPSYAELLPRMFLAGFGGGVVDALLSPLVCALRPREKARAMNFLHAFYCIGAVITLGTAMLLFRAGHGWRIIFAVGAIPSLLAFLGLAFSRVPPSPRSEPGYIPLRRLMLNGPFLILVVAMFLCGGTELGPAQWFPAYLERALGWARQNAGLGLLLFSLTMATGRIACSHVARRVSPSRMIICSSMACVVSIIAMSQPFSAPVSLAGGILHGLAVATLWPTALAFTANKFPGGGATMFAVLAASGNCAGVAFPAAIGFVTEEWNMHWAMGSMALLPNALIMAFVVMGRGQTASGGAEG